MDQGRRACMRRAPGLQKMPAALYEEPRGECNGQDKKRN